jgi:hypothetical protein
MTAATVHSPEFTLPLNEEERKHLLLVLEQVVRDKQVEVHRTEAFAARKLIEYQAAVLEGLLAKLRQA